MTVGEIIRENRVKAGLTQRKLGELLGYKDCSGERVIQLWEHNKQPVPLAKLKNLAKILNVPLEELLP
jgi:transcriptional regulator with XRE-family HTH domain